MMPSRVASTSARQSQRSRRKRRAGGSDYSDGQHGTLAALSVKGRTIVRPSWELGEITCRWP